MSCHLELDLNEEVLIIELLVANTARQHGGRLQQHCGGF